MRKITFLLLLMVGFCYAQETHQLNWAMGINGEAASLTINVGDTVEWEWTEDGIPHTVTNTAGSQESFDSGTLTGLGQTFSYTFTEPGTNPYQCNVHPGTMFGTITVVEPEPEPCVDPSAIEVSAIDTESVEVSWTENGEATVWEIEYGESGFTQGAGELITDDDETLGETISGLTEGVDYELYVRSICEENESNWVGPETFSGALGVDDVYFENFNFYLNQNELHLNAASPIQKVEVFDLSGKKVMTGNPNATTANYDFASINSGIYLVKVTINNTAKTFKIVNR